jgi:invasion protein IalB
VEQTAVLSKTGQLIVLINIRVPTDTHTPVALVQLPLGLNLPDGAKLQVDDGKVTNLPIQTCEARGCYANAQTTTQPDPPRPNKTTRNPYGMGISPLYWPPVAES